MKEANGVNPEGVGGPPRPHGRNSVKRTRRNRAVRQRPSRTTWPASTRAVSAVRTARFRRAEAAGDVPARCRTSGQRVPTVPNRFPSGATALPSPDASRNPLRASCCSRRGTAVNWPQKAQRTQRGSVTTVPPNMPRQTGGRRDHVVENDCDGHRWSPTRGPHGRVRAHTRGAQSRLLLVFQRDRVRFRACYRRFEVHAASMSISLRRKMKWFDTGAEAFKRQCHEPSAQVSPGPPAMYVCPICVRAFPRSSLASGDLTAERPTEVLRRTRIGAHMQAMQ